MQVVSDDTQEAAFKKLEDLFASHPKRGLRQNTGLEEGAILSEVTNIQAPIYQIWVNSLAKRLPFGLPNEFEASKHFKSDSCTYNVAHSKVSFLNAIITYYYYYYYVL